jgi:hypothetical protein
MPAAKTIQDILAVINVAATPRARRTMSAWMKSHVLQRDRFICQYCGDDPETPGYEPHVHHIIPLARGGTDDAINLTVACETCNLAISDRIVQPVGYTKPRREMRSFADRLNEALARRARDVAS